MPPIQQEKNGRLHPWAASTHPRMQTKEGSLNKSVVTLAVMLARLSGLTALATGALSWLGHSLPLAAHMIPGGLLVVALAILTLQPRATASGPLVASVLTLVAIPLLGLMELGQLSEATQWVLRVLHPAVGIAGIALSEIQAKRLRQA